MPETFHVTPEERTYLRELTKKYVEYASLPIMQERTQLWYDFNALQSTIPPIVMELSTFEEELLPVLQCTTDTGKLIEKHLITHIVNHELVDDDKVIPLYFPLHWHIRHIMFGVQVQSTRVKDSRGLELAIRWEHPVHDVTRDLEPLLQPSVREVDREKTLALKTAVEDVLGDILPVVIKGPMLLGNIPDVVFPLMGLEVMMMGMVDHPQIMHALFQRIHDERLAQFRWLEAEGLLTANNENDQIPSGGYAFTHALPAPDSGSGDNVKTCHLWGHLSAQKFSEILPAMYGEFLFPHYHALGKGFGLVHYSCCEPVHTIWDKYVSRIPGMRSISITPWCNEEYMGEALQGGPYLYCRKPDPTIIGLITFDEEHFVQHITHTLRAAKGCHLEFVFRDVYSLGGDRRRAGYAPYSPVNRSTLVNGGFPMEKSASTARIVSQYRGTWDVPPKGVPSIFVVDGPILGNGDVGVVFSGPAESLRVWLSKNDLWKSREYYPNGSICMLGWIDIVTDRPAGARYHMEQALYEAEVHGNFRHNAARPPYTLTIRAWVAATENLLVLELQAEDSPIPLDITLNVKDGNGAYTASGPLTDGQWITRAFRASDLLWPTEAAAAMRILHHAKTALPREALGWPEERFILAPGSPVTVVCALATNHDRADYLDYVRSRVEGLTFEQVEALHAAHRNWWHDFWSRSSIEIGDPVLEGFWYASQYIMASCSRNKRFAPGLYGNWITTDRPAWGSDYHLNYNYQAPWWGVYSSNHVELADPYDPPLLAYLPKARENARTELGCRGVYYEVGIGPEGLGTARGRFYAQKSNASYAAVNMLMRWTYTLDTDYARNIAYPFLREVGDFWGDYLRFENGRYVDYYDAIHEGTAPRDINPLLSLGFIRMIFAGLLELSKVLDMDEDRRPRWQHILNHISPYPTMEQDGVTVFRYSEQGMAWSDSNSLGVQHIFPAGMIGLDTEPTLLEIARNTVAAQSRWEDGNAFPTFYTAAVRVGHDPDEILRNMREQVAKFSLPNLYVFYPGGGIETCGATEAINEMLLQSHERVLRLFSVWPKDRPARFARLRAVGAFLVSSAFWNGEVQYVEIVSEQGQRCTVQNPWPGQDVTLFRQREVAEVLRGERFTFQTTVNEEVILAPEGLSFPQVRERMVG